MHRTSTALAAVALVLLTLAGCSSSKSSTSTATTTGGGASTSAGATTSSATSSTVESGSSSSDFCNLLSAGVDRAKGLAAAVGTAGLASKLAEVKADNKAVLDAAPAELHDAVAKVYAVSEKGQAALDPSLSSAQKAAAASAAMTAMRTPEVKAAIATYKSWVTAHCGTQATKILSGM